MSSVIVCHGCQGRKIVSSLGGMSHSCALCKGIGYVEYDSNNQITLAHPSEPVIHTIDDDPRDQVVKTLKKKLCKTRMGRKRNFTKRLERM